MRDKSKNINLQHRRDKTHIKYVIDDPCYVCKDKRQKFIKKMDNVKGLT